MHKALAELKLSKLVILIICFGLTSILIYRAPTSKAVKKEVPLAQALANIKGWTVSGYTPLGPKIMKALELDDYINHSYSNGNDTISLYIGYYLASKKVGAAHDPLVCFPGQGWVVSDRQKGRIVLNTNPSDPISYSSIMVERGMQKQLLIYWFQSYDCTNPGTFSQKITSLWKKILTQREDNAFVRISISVGEKSLPECRETVFEFIRSFYPVFLNYVRQV